MFERSAGIEVNVPTVEVVNWKTKGWMRINLSDFDPAKHQAVGDAQFPTPRPDDPVAPLKDPKVDDDGVPIHSKPSPMHHA